jgi:Type II secretion system (T2SS), protein G
VHVLDQDRRGLFDGLRVPHSLTGLAISALGLVIYVVGVWGLEVFFEVPGDNFCRLLGGMLGNLSSRLGAPGDVVAEIGGWKSTWTSYSPGVWAVFLIWTATVWALFVGAVQRVAAMKIAREEGVELKEALRFGLRKAGPNLISLLVVIGIVIFFYGGTNATLAGWLGRLDGGDVVVGALFVLVQVATFLTVFAAILGLVGFNLASAAIATEDGEAFDGVARAWNYATSCPWQLLLTYVATFLYLGLVACAGTAFLRLSVKSLSIGDYGMGTAPQVVVVDDEVRSALKLPADSQLEVVYLPGKGEYIYRTIFYGDYKPDETGHIFYKQGLEFALEEYRRDVGTHPPQLGALLVAPQGVTNWRGPYVVRLPAEDVGYAFPSEDQGHRGYDLFTPDADGRPKQKAAQRLGLGQTRASLDVAPLLGGTLSVTVWLITLWINLARILIMSYVVCYFLSAQTVVYFLLRRDVEGDDYSEITLEDFQADLDDYPPLVLASQPSPDAEEEPQEPQEGADDDEDDDDPPEPG